MSDHQEALYRQDAVRRQEATAADSGQPAATPEEDLSRPRFAFSSQRGRAHSRVCYREGTAEGAGCRFL